jgi:hypothetical protein
MFCQGNFRSIDKAMLIKKIRSQKEKRVNRDEKNTLGEQWGHWTLRPNVPRLGHHKVFKFETFIRGNHASNPLYIFYTVLLFGIHPCLFEIKMRRMLSKINPSIVLKGCEGLINQSTQPLSPPIVKISSGHTQAHNRLHTHNEREKSVRWPYWEYLTSLWSLCQYNALPPLATEVHFIQYIRTFCFHFLQFYSLFKILY